ncbi:hypothetical protein F8M41_005811 [Gigaspora margarita]|uniref:Uncharacterized protein n=1 Tax=Gigaspora margarita TaxID=4874 RepID=A0A8H3X8A4_GIGMA|nr:hypothetical protein F8M41_005811 [Gigaspora margarita]
MTVSTSTHLTIVDKISISNKCPLKVSLTGTLQDMPTEINNTDGIIEIIMTDYTNGQEHDYMFRIVFPHNNSRFSHLKTTIRPHDSILFVIGFMEIIGHDLYVYAKEISYVNVKKKKLKLTILNHYQLFQTQLGPSFCTSTRTCPKT